jgi:O-antigen/teichoic acid export membrane protein
MTAIAATKMYPDLKPGKPLAKDKVATINHRIRDLFTSKVGSVVVNSADTIVISAFLGLEMLAIYQNYFYIMTAIIGFVDVILGSCTAGIGNSLIVESKAKNFNDLKKFTFLISWISGFASCCFLNLYQPFMEMWVGKDLMMGMPAVIYLVIYYYVYEINRLLNTYKDAGGIWHSDRFRPLVTAMSNLIMNIIMVQFWGIYGIILSTVLSTAFVGMPWLLHNLFYTMFEPKSFKQYFTKLMYYTVYVTLSCVVTGVICNYINMRPLVTFLVRFVICLIVPNVMYFIAFRKMPEFKQAVELVDRMTKYKIGFLRKLAQ